MSFIKNRGKIVLSLIILALTFFAFSMPTFSKAKATTSDLTFTISYDQTNLETPWRFVGNGRDVMCDEFSTMMSNIDDMRYSNKQYQDVTLIFDNQYIPQEMTFDKGNYIIKAPTADGVSLGYKTVQNDSLYFYYNGQNNPITQAELPSFGVRATNGAKVIFKDCKAYVADLQMGSSDTDTGEIVFDNSTYYLPHYYLTDTANEVAYQGRLDSDYDNEGKISFINGSTFTDFTGEITWTNEEVYHYYATYPYFGDGFTGNLTFIDSYTDRATWLTTTKDLHVENLTMDFTNCSFNECFARLSGERNTTIIGDVTYIKNEEDTEDIYVTAKPFTNLEVRNLTKALKVDKYTVGLADGALLATGDQESLSVINLKTSFGTKVYNETAVEQVNVIQSSQDESTYQAILDVNYYVVYAYGYKTQQSTVYVPCGDTLFEATSSLVNKEVKDYYISSNEYITETERIRNVDLENYVPTAQGATLRFYYSPIKYEIKYENLKGAYIDPDYVDNFNATDVEQVGNDQYIPSINVLMNLPSENEFIFDGWSLSLNGTKINTNKITITDLLCRGFTLYARWINVYTVTIDSLNGDTPTVEYVREGQLATAPTTTPTLAKHEFLNWYDSNDSTKAEFDFTKKITSNVTIKANWLRIWEVTFDASDAEEVGTGFDTTTKTMLVYVPDGETINFHIVSPKKELEKLECWYDADDPNKTPFDFSVINKDVTLKVKWVIKTYNIHFEHTDKDANVTNWPETIENVQIYSSVTAPIPDAPEGYTFKGWYLNGVLFDFSYVEHKYSSEVSTITLNAFWDAIPYEINFDTTMPNGEVPTVINKNYVTIEWVDRYFALPEFLDMDYAEDSKFRLFDFKGFALSPNATEDDVVYSYLITKYNYNNMPTFYAVWVPKQFTITFDSTGSDGATNWPNNLTVDALTVIDDLGTPSRNGYHFIGWFEFSELAPSTLTVERNHSFVAQWEKASYLVNYVTTLPNSSAGPNLDLTGITTMYSVDDTQIVLPTANNFSTQVTGYIFKGWSLSPNQVAGTNNAYTISSTHVFRELTFYACWVEKVYTIEFMLSDGKSQAKIVDVDAFTGKDYLSALKNSSYSGIYNDSTKYVITVSNENHRVTLPNVNELFVSDGSAKVVGYTIGEWDILDTDWTFAEIVSLVSSTNSVGDTLVVVPVFESVGLTYHPWIAETGTYGTLSISYGCDSSDQVKMVFFKYDEQNGYTLLKKTLGKNDYFDAEYFSVGTYNFELVVLLDDSANLDAINSYEDLAGLNRVKVQQVSEIVKGKLYVDQFDRAYIVDEFEYDGTAQFPYWSEEIYVSAHTRLEGEPQVNAGDYYARLVLTNNNFDLYYANGEMATEGYINVYWYISPYDMMLATAHLQYTGSEQRVTIDQLIRNTESIPSWAKELETLTITCEGARVDGHTIYVTGAGEYYATINHSNNYSCFDEDYIAIVVDKMQVAKPSGGFSREWKKAGNYITISDFFTSNVTSLVKFADDTELRPTTIGTHYVTFELLDPENTVWKISGNSVGIAPGGGVSVPDVIQSYWTLEKKEIEFPSIKFYTSQTDFDIYDLYYWYENIGGSLETTDEFEYRIEFVNQADAEYLTIENPSSPSSEEGDKQAYISLLYPEYTCWSYGGSEDSYSRVEVSWNLYTPIEYVYMTFDYWFNNGQVEWNVTFDDPQYSHLEYDVVFTNTSQDSNFSDMMGGDNRYYNEFPQLVEGVNRIEIEVYLVDSDCVVQISPSVVYITYPDDLNQGNQGGNGGGSNDGGEGGSTSQGGANQGGSTGGDAGCGGNVQTPFSVGIVLTLAGLTMAVVKIKSKKNKE